MVVLQLKLINHIISFLHTINILYNMNKINIENNEKCIFLYN